MLKRFLRNVILNTIVLLLLLGLIVWILTSLWNQIVLIVNGATWIFAHVYFWIAIPCFLVLGCASIYFLGMYTPAELSSLFMSRRKRKVFFTVKRHNSLFGGYSHGYVTGMYEKNGEHFYSVIWIFGGASLTTDVPENEFERTDYGFLRLLSLYIFPAAAS